MKSNNINTKRLSLAQIRYFDTQNNGCEIPEINAYAILVKVNDQYINYFNPIDEFAVYGRLPYSNCTLDGESFGNKLYLVSGEEKDGPCYVLEPVNIKGMFIEPTVSTKFLEDFVLKSSLFFPDRIDLIKEKNGILRLPYKKRLHEDMLSMEQLNAYFDSKRRGLIYQKKD